MARSKAMLVATVEGVVEYLSKEGFNAYTNGDGKSVILPYEYGNKLALPKEFEGANFIFYNFKHIKMTVAYKG